MKLPATITLIEVGPRDGLQNEPTVLATELKASYVQKLVAAGLKTIELTSFVRADRIPQMGDAQALYQQVKKHFAGHRELRFPCLVPNRKGLENALAVGVGEIAFFTALSETFNQKNINASIDESLERLAEISQLAQAQNIPIRGYLSTVFGCPYEGEVELSRLAPLIERLFDLGVYEVSLGDTTGVATPNKVEAVHRALQGIDPKRVALHFHDTRGLALVNIYRALQLGYTRFDAASGGLGGCPYAAGASGNVATEDVVYLCHSLGIETGVDLSLLEEASFYILDQLRKPPSSKYLQMRQKMRAQEGA